MQPATAQQLKLLNAMHEELDFFVRASEGEFWSDAITKDKKSFDQLIKLERRMERELAKYLKDLAANRAPQFVNWDEYRKRAAPNIMATELIVSGTAELVKREEKVLLNVVLDMVIDGMAMGAEGNSRIYKMPLDFTSFSAVIQSAARDYAANLVSNVTDVTRNAIRNTIESSIALGENVDTATERLTKIIGDPHRAETIARTESVNAYGAGQHEFGVETNASEKTWDSVMDDRTSPICEELHGQTVPFLEPYDSSYVDDLMHPGAHVNCRSGEYLGYA